MATLKRKTNNGYEPLPAMVVRKTNAENGNGIGTCSTSSGTALVVSLTGYELVTNGFVAVTFSNDVPANATLNVNSKGAKPIIYKGSAIEADTIKADDTVTFAYDGTNYVVTSLGGGGAVALKETVIISLSQQNGSDTDLIGTVIEVTDSFTSDTLLSTTWQGTDVSLDIDSNTVYTVTVGSITGYMTPASQSYKAVPTYTREVDFVYNNSLGIYIEATDGSLYTSSRWANAGKSANAIVVLSTNKNFRIAPIAPQNKSWKDGNADGGHAYYTTSQAQGHYNGLADTAEVANNWSGNGFAVSYARSYTFTYGNKQSYIPAYGQASLIYNNNVNIIAAFTALNISLSSVACWTSTIASETSYYKIYYMYPSGTFSVEHISGDGPIFICCDYD